MEGSSAIDVLLTVLHLVVSVVINGMIFKCLIPKHYLTAAYSSRLWYRSFIEYLVITLPFLVLVTLPSAQLIINLCIIGAVIIASFVYVRKRKMQFGTSNILDLPYIQGREIVLTNFRACINLATCICILAVDFPIFPSKFEKTTHSGFGLMDVGVGCFVFANGLTGVETRHGDRSFKSYFRKTLMSSLPLLLLGVLRLIVVASIGYHYSIEEYGVHWNFFFTLGLVKIIGPIISFLLPFIPSWAKSMAVSVLYEVFLLGNLRPWILSKGHRDTFISANREGIYSLFGYLSIYWIAVEVGRFLNEERKTVREWMSSVLILAGWALAFWISMDVLSLLEGPPSRRAADLAYILWMISFNMSLLCVLFAGDMLLLKLDSNPSTTEDKGSSMDLSQHFTSISSLPFVRVPYIYKSINYNGLLFFLFSNVLTGLVNMSMYTGVASGLKSFVVLNVYVVIICVFALTLYLWRLKFKFW